MVNKDFGIYQADVVGVGEEEDVWGGVVVGAGGPPVHHHTHKETEFAQVLTWCHIICG